MRTLKCLWALFLSFSLTGALAAQTAVVPAEFSAVEGNSSYGLPDDFVVTFQQLYSQASLSDLPNGVFITGMRLRLNGGVGTGPAVAFSFANYDVLIGTSPNDPGSLSNVVADNLGTDTIVARTGALTWSVDSFPGGSTPNNFGPLIPFTTPYLYGGGNLLLTVTHTAGGGSFLTFDGHFYDPADGLAHHRQSIGNFDSATVDENFDGYALIVQFEYSAIPEPATLTLIGLAVAGGGLCGWQQRKRKARVARSTKKFARG